MSDPLIRFAPPDRRPCWLLGLTGVAEVLVLTGMSMLIARFAEPFIPYHQSNLLGLVNGTTPDYVQASFGLGLRLGVQYGSLIVLILIVGVFRSRTTLASYALAPKTPLLKLARYGVLLGFVTAIIPSLVSALQEFAPIGRDTGWWFLVRTSDWDWGFWLFSAVSCIIAIPVLNEFIMRGYILGRLSEGFSPGTAILITTVLSLPIYIHLLSYDAAYATMFIALLAANIAAGCSVVRTGSIIPAIIAHAIVALPLPGEAQVLRIMSGFAALSIFAPSIIDELRRWAQLFGRRARHNALLVTAGLVTLVFVAEPSAIGALILGVCLLVTVAMTTWIKKSAWRIEPD
jgi:membrane protease YdiL (CAAX protease family)